MKKSTAFVIAHGAIISVLVATIAIGISLTLYINGVKSGGSSGQVSLRSYYEEGDGSVNKPFVITRPRHLYNLSRLQGLGVYGDPTNPVYFQLGKVGLNGDDSGFPVCYVDETNETKPYLDMTSSTLINNPINAIGTEANPFYGHFNGQNVEIKHLQVFASPQDAGLFGYTAHGSSVSNLFLHDITINAFGYTSENADLYNPESTIGNNVYFIYDPDPNSVGPTITYNKEYEDTNFSNFYANNLTDFEYTSEGSDPIPTLTIHAPENYYTFTSLLSGDLIKFDQNNNIVPNMDRLFEFFKEKKDAEGAAFPLQASSTASLIVSSVDGYGLKHSKVLLTVEYDFTLETGTTNFISMGVRVSSDHGNNIGLIIGHCDGTLSNCYVYNGSFQMNNGGEGYFSLPNGSNLGLVGRVGGTVENILAEESDVGVKDGKNIGVLDFTTIYKDIISSTSFNGSHAAAGVTAGVTYNPILTSKYLSYLRKNNNDYITLEADAVSFKGQEIVNNTDLGVFTVATDAMTSGTGTDSGQSIDRSVILSDDDLAIDGSYYVYYATGEYSKEYHSKYKTGLKFSDYIGSFNIRTGTTILPGYHLPQRDQLSLDSFETRESRQNYFFRFKLDPTNRKLKGKFYFADVDTNTDGGAFLANYFSYKLVDQNSQRIPVGDSKCGVMLKNNLRQEISSFSASFACPKTSYLSKPVSLFAMRDTENKPYVSNMVNFEIKNELANVTIVAAPSTLGTSSALGIYKLDDTAQKSDFEVIDGNLTFTQAYNDPDYAFFMPANSNLSYFDYRVNPESKAIEVGTYQSGVFGVAENSTDPTVPAEYGKQETGYSNNKTRLFAHTFLLPAGRYCIGSACSNEATGFSLPKVYYICAQGQDDGQFDFDDNVFASTDVVENVDFINTPRFALNGTENIIIEDITVYNPNDPDPEKRKYLGNRRLYVALVNSDRSQFGSTIASNLSFTYDTETGEFLVTSTLTEQQVASVITHLALNNYQPSVSESDVKKNLTVVLLGIESDEEVIVYPIEG